MTGLRVRPLDVATWPDFAGLVERHKGVWGGCWCMAFHPEGLSRDKDPEQNRSKKETRVREGRAHAALVYDGQDCVGWSQFGTPAELPRIKHRRAYEKDLDTLPDWRVTCFFVDRAHRGRGVAAAALEGALQEIARLGGGSVEGYPEDTEDRKVSASLLFTGTVTLFEGRGFERIRRLGKHHWVMSRAVPPAAVRAGRTAGS
ncbi:GNAT family N-acetyltransferase [Streptomyces olindensis]|uniref:GNAT family N-acetyltransferase n=1 Tax=Streptomyces olindensis TaxID=358823 RepID=A0ABV2XSK0_9ACTN